MLTKKQLHADLCVIGGGMAGICAAVSAARNGCSVVLMHERPVLGGNASSEIRMWVCGAQEENARETGIIEEIALENYYRNPTKNFYLWDTVLYDFVIREQNITLLLNCTCMDAETETGDFEDGRSVRIKNVSGYQMTTQTMYEVCCKNYADCSGDSILAPLTGAEFRWGRESADEFGEDTSVRVPDRKTMGMSCLLQGRETTNPVTFTPPKWAKKLTKEDFGGRRMPDLKCTGENFWYLELGGEGDTIADTEEVARDLIPLAIGTWDFIKNSGNYSTENWDLDFLGFLPGKRESRRMMGEYIITERDIAENRIFEDTVAYGGWPIDDHYPGGFYHPGPPNRADETTCPYCIPYRSLYSKNVSNLFFAGRNISMTHMAMSSIRVMATCAVMGEAVGTAAALAAQNHLTPHGVYREKLHELQNTLANHDCFLPYFTREVSEVCKETPIEHGADSLKNGLDRPQKIYPGVECGCAVQNGEALAYQFKSPQSVKSVHITFDSDLNRETLPGDSCERYHLTRCNVLLDSPQFYVPKTLCKHFKLELTDADGDTNTIEETCNLKRSYHIPVKKELSSIRLIPIENWGDTENTTVFSFDFR